MSRSDISAQLEIMAASNIGGVSIVPIYGEVGDEANYIEFLSKDWLDMLAYISSEARRLGMGVDMTLGTGWPFGGKNVSKLDAAKRLDANLHCANTMQMVKRAAPGGEGLVLNPFSASAMQNYAEDFKKAFGTKGSGDLIRSFFNDSYEVFGANWSDDFLAQFKRLRGYDFAQYQTQFMSDTLGARQWQDYHNTISDLLLEGFTINYAKSCRQLGSLSRNQAHGSVGNLCDLYAACDIPETESFGSSAFKIPLVRVDEDYNPKIFGRPDKMMMKFASSAANVCGKELVSAETATWLANHFKVSLSQIKPQVDELFLGGINHIFYHGTTYSPVSKPFPGRLFYASTNFNYNSHFARYLPELSNYIYNCQQKLQTSKSDNDILVYFPVHAFWKSSGGENKVLMFDVHHAQSWLKRCENFDALIRGLDARGYAFDYISDRQISTLRFENGKIKTPSNASYRALVFADSSELPIDTFEALLKLSKQGANIIFENKIPRSVTGAQSLSENLSRAQVIADEMERRKDVKFGDVEKSLREIGLVRESICDMKLQFIRKQTDSGAIYFISNLNDEFYEGEVELSKKCNVYQDPLTNKKFALPKSDGSNTKFYLRLNPGQSCFVYADKTSGLPPLNFGRFLGQKSIKGQWNLDFINGYPQNVQSQKMSELKSWTLSQDDSARYFSGEVLYSNTFDIDDLQNCHSIDLGDLREMATVKINGIEIGKSWCVPYRLEIPQQILKAKGNTLEIFVTNLSFNRIIKMDIDKIKWRTFREINFVDITYKPFDASKAKPVESGILGEVKILSYSKVPEAR